MCTNRNHQEKSCCTIDHEVYVVKSVMLNICVHVYTLTSTPLAFPSPLPAIMCSWGVFSGPWLSFPPPLPSHFLITSPLPSLTGAQTRLSLRYSTFRSVPHFLAVLRHDPAVTGNGHLQRSFLSLAQCLSHTLRLSPPPTSLQAHTLGTGHRSFQAPWVWWGNYSPLWSPPAPLPLLTARLWVGLPLLYPFFTQWESSLC